MPGAREADSLRFAIAKDEGTKISLQYVFDREHAPAEHGQVVYDLATQAWIATLADPCAQRQAECYLQIYLERRPRRTSA